MGAREREREREADDALTEAYVAWLSQFFLVNLRVKMCVHVSEPPVRNMNLYISTQCQSSKVSSWVGWREESDGTAGTRDRYFPGLSTMSWHSRRTS
jgi:hypothetical protein